MNDLLKDDELLCGELRASSAGTSAFYGDGMNMSAIEALDVLGVRHGVHLARRVTSEIVDEADLILTMEARQLYELLELYPNSSGKAYTLLGYAYDGQSGDVKDPFFMPVDVYISTARELTKAISSVLARFNKWDNKQ